MRVEDAWGPSREKATQRECLSLQGRADRDGRTDRRPGTSGRTPIPSSEASSPQYSPLLKRVKEGGGRIELSVGLEKGSQARILGFAQIRGLETLLQQPSLAALIEASRFLRVLLPRQLGMLAKASKI